MRTCNRHFPGTDSDTSDRLASDVAADEKAMIAAISELRQKEAISLEAIGFLLGADPGQLSRYLKGTASTTMTNYVRIARVLGYRCRLMLEKADASETDANPLAEMKISSHKVFRKQRRTADLKGSSVP